MKDMVIWKFSRRKCVTAVAVLTIICTATTAGASVTPKRVVPHVASTNITIALGGGQSVSQLPYLVALKEGYFDNLQKKLGVTITESDYGSGAAALAAVGGGSANMLTVTGNSQMTSNAQNQDLVAIVNMGVGGATLFVGAEKYKATAGTNLSGYNGLTWGFTGPGSTGQFLMEAAAIHSGLAWGSQKQLSYGAFASAIPTLQAGRADIVVTDAAGAARAISTNTGYVVLNSNKVSVGKTEGWGTIIGVDIATTASFVRNYPQETQMFVDDIIRAEVQVRQLTAKAAKVLALLPPSFTTPTNVDNWAQIWNLQSPSLTGTNGEFTPAMISATAQFDVTAGTLTSTTQENWSRFFTNQFVKTAYKDLHVAPLKVK